MLTTVVNKIKDMITGKILWGAIIVLTTLLTVSHFDNKSKTEQITDLTALAQRSVEQTKRLTDEISYLKGQLETMPSKQIETVKEVMIEVCNGELLKSKIEALPTKREVKNDPTETNTADIDDRLPSDLKRLLQ